MTLFATGLVTSIVVGVVAGSLVGHTANHRRRPTVLPPVAALLGFATTPGVFGVRTTVTTKLPMGEENAVFERGGDNGAF